MTKRVLVRCLSSRQVSRNPQPRQRQPPTRYVHALIYNSIGEEGEKWEFPHAGFEPVLSWRALKFLAKRLLCAWM